MLIVKLGFFFSFEIFFIRNLFRIKIHMKINQVGEFERKFELKTKRNRKDITVDRRRLRMNRENKYALKIYDAIFRMGFSIISLYKTLQTHHNQIKRYAEQRHIFVIYLPQSSFVLLLNANEHHVVHILNARCTGNNNTQSEVANPLIKCNCSIQHKYSKEKKNEGWKEM